MEIKSRMKTLDPNNWLDKYDGDEFSTIETGLMIVALSLSNKSRLEWESILSEYRNDYDDIEEDMENPPSQYIVVKTESKLLDALSESVESCRALPVFTTLEGGIKNPDFHPLADLVVIKPDMFTCEINTIDTEFLSFFKYMKLLSLGTIRGKEFDRTIYSVVVPKSMNVLQMCQKCREQGWCKFCYYSAISFESKILFKE